MKRPRKAVIPAAGLGTRFLPATKAVPKEMLPIVDIPTIQYIVQEALDSGIEDIVIVNGRGKSAIEDHFDHSPELEQHLEEKGKRDLLQMVQDIARKTRVVSVRQKEPLGLGHAVLCARHAVGDEPFVVLLGDDIVDHPVPCAKQLMDVFASHGPVVGLRQVSRDETKLYGVIEGTQVAPRTHRISTLVEKPDPAVAPSTLAVLARYVLPPEIFDVLARTPPGKGGEIQLTDGLQLLARQMPLFGYEFEGERYDAGDKLGFLEAQIAFAMRRPDLGPRLKPVLRRYAGA